MPVGLGRPKDLSELVLPLTNILFWFRLLSEEIHD
ncbi:hypothetical protein DYBT9275_05284 [Dyadobacter sp. CECT 9275]|uniref:Uncharacterized protein n=1 Tax=Dyadobacter helix TaxID=2822344 RepID=A0A916NNI6_9BACT|nr:hypothetical protein DYBT9275_05284 [Dyadobacter sp. CECT 9275]